MSNMQEHDVRHWFFLPVEMLIFTAFGQAGHLFAAIPPWIGGGISALVVGVLLRVLEPALRRYGDRLSNKIHKE